MTKPKHPVKLERFIDNPILCNGKRRYETREEAEITAEEQQIMHPELKLRVYPCSLGCRGWHLTRIQEDPFAINK